MPKNIENKIKVYFKDNKVLSRDQLICELRKDFPSWSSNTINTYLYKLKKKDIINNITRGVYTLENERVFGPKTDSRLKKIATKIHKNYPFINYCVWNTSWLNDFMLHQPFKQFTVIEVEKSAVEQVFVNLSYDFKNVYLNPDSLFFERYISTMEDAIIIKNLHSESPTMKLNNIVVPMLEKILVDMLIDEDLFSAQQGELDYIFKSAYKKYTINESKMKRYASRRNRETELEKRINIVLAK
ncbi:DUF6577 family protein [Flavobacterium sp.]|uniref:DUF6577 family protein n=1 Tax=Flavobacterium sp. TaxID=239 RepID=UPI0026204D7B|nr:DUF6577 family protein [Flavobacterium sp.]